MITIIIALVIAFIWGYSELYYKKATNEYLSINILFHNYVFEIIAFLLFVLVFDIEAFTRFNMRIFIYLVPIAFISAFLGGFLYLYALKDGNLSIVSPILASDPIYTIIIGILLFKEKISMVTLILLIIICASIFTLNFVNTVKKEKTKKLAIFLASLYAFVVAVTTTLEKSVYLSGFKITDFYFHYVFLLIIIVLILLIIMKIKHIELKKPNKDVIMSNSLTRTGNILHSYLLTTSYISIVSPLTGLYSVVSYILGVKVLKEKLAIKQKICVYLIILSTILLLFFNS